MAKKQAEQAALGYSVSKWQTNPGKNSTDAVEVFDNYECDDCAYSTIYLEKMTKHRENNLHPWGKEGQGKPPDSTSGPTY